MSTASIMAREDTIFMGRLVQNTNTEDPIAVHQENSQPFSLSAKASYETITCPICQHLVFKGNIELAYPSADHHSNCCRRICISYMM